MPCAPTLLLTRASAQPLPVSCLFIGHPLRLRTLAVVLLVTVVEISILEYGPRALLVLCGFSLMTGIILLPLFLRFSPFQSSEWISPRNLPLPSKRSCLIT